MTAAGGAVEHEKDVEADGKVPLEEEHVARGSKDVRGHVRELNLAGHVLC